MTVDDMDLKILEFLQEDGRLPHATIGEKIGLTGPSVYSRIKRLEREGVIRGYTVLLNAEAMGRGLVAFIRLATQTTANEYQPFEEFVLNEPLIMECYDVDGEDSYILKVQTDTPQNLRALLSRLRGFPGVTRTVTSIALYTIKEAGSSGLNITKN